MVRAREFGRGWGTTMIGSQPCPTHVCRVAAEFESDLQMENEWTSDAANQFVSSVVILVRTAERRIGTTPRPETTIGEPAERVDSSREEPETLRL
jgi:hypothetical protein